MLFLTSRVGRSTQTVDYYRKCLQLLYQSDPNRNVHAFTTREIAAVLAAYEHIGSQRTYRRGLNAFFNWAVRARYCLENPCDHLEALPRQKRNVVILQLDEVRQLLRAAQSYHEGELAASVAILLFAGLRPSELADLKTTDIRTGNLIIYGGKMEGKIKRRVPIVPPLKAWLDQYPFTGVPKNWYKKMGTLKNAVQPAEWVSDILRHTSISYQIERDEDIGKVATRNGTSDSMIMLHYRDVVENPQDVTAYWRLSPDVVEKVTLKGSLPDQQSVKWPDDKELAKLVFEKPLTRLAKDLGISDNAIRKRCIKRGIKLPKNGHLKI
ncbi:MAG: hypothetical protein Q7Q73_03655 [Verrucomicrobiota bacterium JB024]|nr:hypothetical protein [Verrucomicrobiota bacterium JB024]